MGRSQALPVGQAERQTRWAAPLNPRLPPALPPLPQSGTHAGGSNPACPAAVAGGPSTIFAPAADRKLRALEDAPGGGLAVAAEVDAGAVVTQVLAPGPGAGWAGLRGGWGAGGRQGARGTPAAGQQQGRRVPTNRPANRLNRPPAWQAGACCLRAPRTAACAPTACP